MTSEALIAIGIIGGLMALFSLTLAYGSIVAGENLAE